MSEDVAKVNANAPVKNATVELARTDLFVFIATPNGGIAGGPRLVAQGRCPGRGCGETFATRDPRTLNGLAQSRATPGLARHALGKARCSGCGQEVEMYSRLVQVAT